MHKVFVCLIILIIVQNNIFCGEKPSVQNQYEDRTLQYHKRRIEDYKAAQQEELNNLQAASTERLNKAKSDEDRLGCLKIFLMGKELIDERYKKLIDKEVDEAQILLSALSKSEY